MPSLQNTWMSFAYWLVRFLHRIHPKYGQTLAWALLISVFLVLYLMEADDWHSTAILWQHIYVASVSAVGILLATVHGLVEQWGSESTNLTSG